MGLFEKKEKATATKAMQKFLGVDQDGVKGPNTIKAWQTWCNHNL